MTVHRADVLKAHILEHGGVAVSYTHLVFNARTRHSLLALRIQPAAPGGISPAVL